MSADERERRPAGRRPSRHRARIVAEAAVCFTVVGAPLAIGGVHPVVFVAVAALGALALLAAARWRGSDGLPAPAAAWALLGGAALALATCVPLPAFLAGLLSPRAARLAALPPEPLPSFFPISLDFPATLVDAARLAGFACLALATAALARRDATARRLAMALALAGVACAVVGGVHLAFGLDELYGVYPASGRLLPTPFINPNHAASLGVLSACVAAGLARAVAEPLTRLAWAAAAALSGAMALFSLSLAGMASLVVGLALLVLLARARAARLADPAAGGLFALVAFSAALLVAGEVILDEWRTLEDAHVAKWHPWPGVLQLIADHPLTGVGRGAFGAAFQAYAPPRLAVSVTHPENLVLQWVAEWGVPAALAGLVFLGLTLWRARRAEADDAFAPVQEALVAGVAAVVAHDLLDFGLEFAGVGVPVVVAVGLAGGRAASRARLSSGLAYAPAGLALGLAALAVWAIPRLADAELAQLTAASSLPPAERDAKFREVRRRHPADALIPLRAGESLLEAARGAGETRRDAIVRALPHLARAQELSTGDQPHLLAARALAATGARSQALTELRLAFVAGQRFNAAVDEALRLDASAAEIASLLTAYAAARADADDDTVAPPPAELAAHVTYLLLLERGRPALAFALAHELHGGPSPAPEFESPTSIRSACAAAWNSADCSGRRAGCAPERDMSRQAEFLRSFGDRLRARTPPSEEGVLCAMLARRLDGDIAAARATLEGGLTLLPDSVRIRVVLGETLLQEGRPADAAAALEGIPPPLDPIGARDLARVSVNAFWHGGRRLLAVTMAESMASQYPGEVWSHRLLAQLREWEGYPAHALSSLVAAEQLASGPELEEIRTARRRLESRPTTGGH